MSEKLSDYEVCLIITDGQLYPFSSHGFEFAQGRLSEVARRIMKSLVLDESGDLKEIINVLPQDSSSFARLLRLVGFAYRVEVEFRPASLTLEELKEKIIVGLATYRTHSDDHDSWMFAQRAPAVADAVIWDARDAKTLISALELPPAEDCLDLL